MATTRGIVEPVPTKWSEIKRTTTRNPGGGESLTKTDQAWQTDLNVLVPRYLETGQFPASGKARYMDLTGVPDLQTALGIAARAKEAFQALPAGVRDACGNDPVRFVEMLKTGEGAELLKARGLDIEITRNDPNPKAGEGSETPA